MSVYQHGQYWHYDFVLRGKRYHGSTGQKTKRAAEAVERTRRLEAGTNTGPDAGDLTLDEAAGKYWDEIGQYLRSSKDLNRQLHVMMRCVGKGTRLRDIDGPMIVQAIAKRRGLNKNRKKPPAPATVNRDIIDFTLRPMLRRARRTWGAKNMPEVDWGALRLREPKGLVQEYTADQITAWRGQLEPLPRLCLDLLTVYGLRFGELFFRPDAVDGKGARLTIQGRYRKNGEELKQPLTKQHARLLAALASEARGADRETVMPFAYRDLHKTLTKAARRAGIKSPRVIHGVRHHAATVMLRKTNNLQLTREYMGHASLTSTIRYAHVNEQEIRDAIGEISRHSPDENPEVRKKRTAPAR